MFISGDGEGNLNTQARNCWINFKIYMPYIDEEKNVMPMFFKFSQTCNHLTNCLYLDWMKFIWAEYP